MKRFAIIGDIHGEYEKLKMLFKNSDIRNRKILLLGDIINRGPGSKEVIELILCIEKKYDLELLLGNHEFSLITYLKNKNFFPFALLGGIQTIKSYIKMPIVGDVHKLFFDAFPPSHLEFLKKAKLYYEDENYLISHTGISPSNVHDRSLNTMVLSSHEDIFRFNSLMMDKTIIFGHYPQKNFKPLIKDNIICLDTGAGYKNGKLSLLFLPEKEIFQY